MVAIQRQGQRQREVEQRNSSRAVGYLRRSTDRQEQSIPDQKKAVEAYALSRGLRLEKFYIDDAISGTSTIGRKAFQQMIADAQRPDNPFSIIVVYDVKRFGRVDNDEAGYYRHLLRRCGVEVLYATENFTGDGTDDLLRPVKQWQAREESKDLSKVTIRGLLSKADGGWWMGGVPPHGYDLRYETAEGKFLFVLRHMPDGSKQVHDDQGKLTRTLDRGESLGVSKRDRAKLTFSEKERVDAVRSIFKWYANEGRGFCAIADLLNRRGIPTPRGPSWASIYSGQWTDTTVRSILVNPIYCGDMVWNRRTDGRFHRIEEGRAVPRQKVHAARLEPNDPADWLVVRDAHAALVDRRTFQKAKDLREAKLASLQQRERANGESVDTPAPGVHRVGSWHGTRSRFALSGLLSCARCGSRYQGVTRQKGKKRRDGSVIKNYYYGCGGYITKGTAVCEMGAIRQEVMEKAVIEAVLTTYRPYFQEGGRKKLTDAVRQQMGGEVAHLAAARKRLEDEQEKLKVKIDTLLDNLTSANREFVDQRLAELTKQRDQLRLRVEELDALSASQRQVKDIVDEVWVFLLDLERILCEGLPEEKKAALQRCVRKVVVDGKNTIATAEVIDLSATEKELVSEVHVNLV